ncbi:unnamed protein product [Linum trigynum]|uniref:Uncharacterized protein n=1 Tax=Linum trigynum TaxID=586398 RepID=A0AAV2F402_9ROSI
MVIQSLGSSLRAKDLATQLALELNLRLKKATLTQLHRRRVSHMIHSQTETLKGQEVRGAARAKTRLRPSVLTRQGTSWAWQAGSLQAEPLLPLLVEMNKVEY